MAKDSQPFFDAIDGIGVAEHHAKQVGNLQDDEARRMISEYSQAKEELTARLQRTPGDTFTAQHLRLTLLQVDRALRVMNSTLHTNILTGARVMTKKGVEHLEAEIRKFSSHFKGAETEINLDAAKISTHAENILINRYQASINAYDAEMRKQISNGLTQAVIQEKPFSQVIRDMGKFFTGEEWKLNQIVRTEMHSIYGQAKITGMKEAKKELPRLMKALYHRMDSRTGNDSIQLAAENPIIPIDKPFKQTYKASPKSKTQYYEFMAPPNRPNDRAILIPFSEDWEK